MKEEPMIFIIYILLALSAVGYWRNLIGVMAMGDAGPIDRLFALKLAGVFFPPLGAWLGWA